MKRRKINASELSKILKEHKRWIDTDEDEGEKANLRCAKLREANMSCTDLNEADLSNADLFGADLKGANLIRVRGLTIEQLSKVKTV